MWPNNTNGALVVLGGFLLVGVIGYQCTADSARLHPASREIVVRQVENGYVVEAHVRNNPYPYREAVFVRPDEVGAAVAGLLNERVPSPLWGR